MDGIVNVFVPERLFCRGTESILENTMDQIAISATKGKLYVGETQKKWMQLTLEISDEIKEVVDSGRIELAIGYGVKTEDI